MFSSGEGMSVPLVLSAIVPFLKALLTQIQAPDVDDVAAV